MGPAAAQPAPTTLTPAEAREALLAPGRKAKRFEPSTLIERAAVQTLIPVLAARALAGDRQVADLRALAHGAEFEIDLWHVGEADFLAMHESRPRGAGAYIFRLGPRDPAGEALLQAPHAYFDLHTGRVATALFFNPPAGRAPRALFVNTAQRYGYGPPVEHSPADVCHRPEHLFNAATWLAARALSPVQVVQLHGFDAESVPEGVMAILSEGRPQPASAALSEQAARLKGAFSGDVRRFPDDITVLGGTTNVQGRLLAGLPGVRFVHVEMSVALRARLRKTAAARNALAEALFAPLGGSAP